MPRSPSTDASSKGSSKRKGTRSVSTLTPQQLERKRANDREAQRAIRARTKEHIDRLEREIADLKSALSRDQTVQELLHKNRALEEELFRLKEASRHSSTHSYPNSGYEDNLSSVSGAVPSPRSSPFPATATYGGMAELGPSYVPMPDTTSDPWGNAVPISVASNVSSPSSSANTDDFGPAAAYIPTSIPTSMMEARNLSSAKLDYDDVDSVRRSWLHPAAPAPSPSSPASSRPPPDGRRDVHVPRAMECVPNPVLPGPLSSKPNGSPYCQGSAAEQWIVNFVRDCRFLQQKRSIDALIRPSKLDVRTLLEYHPHSPTRPPPATQLADLEHALDGHGMTGSQAHPLVELTAALFDDGGITQVLERLGYFVPVHRIFARHIDASGEVDKTLPSWLAPRPSQLRTVHPIWVDFFCLPQARDLIIEQPELYATNEFRQIFGRSLRLSNWPHRPVDALHVDQDSGAMWMADDFIAHAVRPENWTLEESFFHRFPELRGRIPAEIAA